MQPGEDLIVQVANSAATMRPGKIPIVEVAFKKDMWWSLPANASKWIQNTNDILPDETLKLLLDEWKDDYESWMNQKTQDEWRRLQRSNRREWTSVRFGNFLFKICGFYHLVIFWLYVHASPTSLSIFRQVFCEETSSVWKETSDDKLKRAVQAVRDAEIRSFTAVRRLH